MDLNRIAVFVQVVRAGSFTAAGRQLGVPKTTVSRKVAALEADLGVRLLNRTTRSIGLTDAGRRYYALSRDGVAALESANRQATEEQDVPKGTVRVTAPAEDHFLSGAVTRFVDRYPAVRVEMVLTDARVDLVGENIDVAFRGGKLADSSLMARKLAGGGRIIVAASAYLADAGYPKTPADLSRHACVIHGTSAEGATWTLGGPSGTEAVHVSGRIAANSVMFVLRACVAGAGLALLPETIARRDVDAGSIVRVLPDWAAETGGLYLVYPSSKHQPAAVRTFIDFMMKEAIPGLRRGGRAATD